MSFVFDFLFQTHHFVYISVLFDINRVRDGEIIIYEIY